MASRARRADRETPSSHQGGPREVTSSGPGGAEGTRTVYRSAATGRFVPTSASASPRSRSGSDQLAVLEAAYAAGPEVVEPRPAPRKTAARAGGRSKAADDPLAPERTRWLAEVVGGGARLAELLGVSASQTSRWAAGQERPGIQVAPLLIDLEHVLARVRLVWAEPAATTWMTSTNAHLGGARPVDVLRLHGPGPVLDALDVGAWGGAA